MMRKYGVTTEFIDHTTFKDIYGDYLIMQKARTECDGEIIQNLDYEMYEEMIKEEILAMSRNEDIEIGNIDVFE